MQRRFAMTRSHGRSSRRSSSPATRPTAGTHIGDLFRHFAAQTSERVGSAWAFAAATALVVGWAVSGPVFDYSSGWQLVINTATTILTFLMVFLIQNSQNRDAKAIQLKLDELLRSVAKARTGLVGLEHLSDEELAKLEEQFDALRADRCPAPDPAEKKSSHRGSHPG
jgi:low affinity Fe/Cu permease